MYYPFKPTIRALLEVVFPLRLDARIVKNLDWEALEALKQGRTLPEVTSLLPFSYQQVRACVHEVKYHRNQRAINLLATILHEHLKKLPESPLIIPIPLSPQRLRERGYNQTELITRMAIKGTNCSLDSEILQRVKDTAPQTTLKKADRVENVKDAFAIYDFASVKNKIAGQHLIIFDDVTTTGATLKAAKAALSPHHPASITLLAIAH